jgi:hypothetical protein
MAAKTTTRVLSFEAGDGSLLCDVKFDYEECFRELDYDGAARFYVQVMPEHVLDEEQGPCLRIGMKDRGSDVRLQMSTQTARQLAALIVSAIGVEGGGLTSRQECYHGKFEES